MEFTYSPEQLELRDRAQSLTDAIIPFEIPCEEGRGLPDASLAEIRRLTLDHRLNAINMPAEWGGQGLSMLDQVIVSERLGQLTNALWDAVWRPANALRHCTPAQRERYLLPAIAGDRRDCFAVTEEKAGSDPSLIETVAVPDGDGGYATDRREVVRDRRRRRRLHDRAGAGRRRARADAVPGRQGLGRRQRQADARLHAHVRVRAPGVPVRRGGARPRAGARRDRRRL